MRTVRQKPYDYAFNSEGTVVSGPLFSPLSLFLSTAFLKDKGKEKQGKRLSSWNLARYRFFMFRFSYRSDFWYTHTRLQLQIIAWFRPDYYVLTIYQTVMPWGHNAWHLLAGHAWGHTLWECHILNMPLSPERGKKKKKSLTWQRSIRKKSFGGIRVRGQREG